MSKRWLLLIIPALLALLAGLLLAASEQNQIAPGTKIAGVAVGNMSQAEASERVRQEVVKPIEEKKIIIKTSSGQGEVNVRDLDVSLPLSRAVAEAHKSSQSGPFWVSGFRQLAGSDDNIALVPRPNKEALNREAERLTNQFTVKARDAELSLTASGPKIKEGRNGRTIRGGRAAVRSAILAGLAGKRVTLTSKTTSPQVGSNDLRDDYSIVVVKSKFKAHFYRGERKIKSYGVAIGQPAYPTPEGLFKINGKQVNPVWSVPNSAWAGELAGTTVAGGTAANPLVARWMGLADGVGFHGTREEGSIGTAASHGCLRMRPADIIEWYPKVPEGTPVLITG